MQSLKSGESKELFPGDWRPISSDRTYRLCSGEIIFSPCRLILDRLEVAGGPVPVVEGVFRNGGMPQYAVSDSGTLVYMPGTATTEAAVRKHSGMGRQEWKRGTARSPAQ